MTTAPDIKNVRVRFAPSPTGMMHIGGVRTALFNWIFARQTGGKFILRIEDTDRKRYDPQALDSIKAALKWLGLDWDEGPKVGGEYGPYFQSERREIYERYAERLTQSGAAYYCDCDSERLDQMRARQKAEKAPPGYDGHCRERNLTPTNAAAKAMAVRFKVPRAGEISFADEIHGQLTFALNTINDFIILKSDGMPTYHLAHVVDDSEMKISHVIRGEEWISSVPKHLLIQRALKFTTPKYVHVPLLLGKDRSKLSKRDGAVAVDEYIAAGYLPDAIFNFLALLGWSPGDDYLPTDVWQDIQPVLRSRKESAGYPTQKPLALLERIIAASSNEGGLVLDPFCGCATACVAAEKLDRHWIGIDVSEKAYELVKERLRKEVADPEDRLKYDKQIQFSADPPTRTDDLDLD